MEIRSAHQLAVGDVIIAPDGSRHTITEIQHPELERVWLTIVTDTGVSINKSRNDANLDDYNVVPRVKSST
jgi:hypothetical protein